MTDKVLNYPKNSAIYGDSYIQEIIFSIRKLIQAGEIYTKELNKVYNVSSAQLNCLMALYENGDLSPSQIAKNILVNSSTVTGILDRLEYKNLVKRLRISSDRRVLTIKLTEAGQALAENAPPPIQQKIITGLKRLSDNEKETITKAIATLINMLEVQDLDVE